MCTFLRRMNIGRLCFSLLTLIYFIEGLVVFVNENSTAELHCPFNESSWNGPPDFMTYTLNKNINPKLPHKDRISIVGSKNNLQISSVQQSDAGQYQCTGTVNGLTKTDFIEIAITVAPLNDPAISIVPTGSIIAGSTIKLICTISGGYPLPIITWECTGSDQAENGSDSTVAVSTVQLVVTEKDNGNMCQCTGSHPLWTPERTATISLDIKYAPDDNLSIQQVPSGGLVRDSLIKLTCTVTGGNPLATLTWDCNGVITNKTNMNSASYSITFIANRTYNNRICTCFATHVISSFRPSRQHKMIVYYEPMEDPIIKQTPATYLISGANVILKCEVSGGYPLAILSWNCTGTATNNTSVGNASYGVEFAVDRTYDKMICACSASHPVSSYRPVVRHHLVVYYAPYIHMEPKYNPYTIYQRQENVILKCVLDGSNPSEAVEYNWITPSGIVTSQNLTISIVNKSHSGQYSCTATNIVGKSDRTSKDIIVHYGPHITNIGYQNITRGKNLTVHPIVDAFPVAEVIIWTKESDANFKYDGYVLKINNIQITSSGNYTFLVMNTLIPSGMTSMNTTTQKRFYINVQFEPFLDDTRPYSSSYISAARNNSLQIKLTVTANPTPIIEWIFQAEMDWNPCNFSTIVSNTTTDGLFTVSSILIKNVQSNNFGDYTFTAKNTFGLFFRKFKVVEEASLKQDTCAPTKEDTGIFVAGMVTFGVGLLSLTTAVFCIVRNNVKNKPFKSFRSDEQSCEQRSKSTFADACTTLQSDIELKSLQEPITNTYEECRGKSEALSYNYIDAKGSEPIQHLELGNTYEECEKKCEAHEYETLDK